MRLAWIAPLLVLASASAGCGGMSDEERFSLTTPGTDDLVVREIEVEDEEEPRRGRPTAAEIAVIRGWADALRAGHVNAAAEFFDVPVAVLDGTNALRSLSRSADVREFNRGLPCGAKLVRAARGEHSRVLATFELTERPGPGTCEGAVGALANTSFLIEDRHITQWLREPDPAQPDDDTS
jgi:hypothetical protein